MTRDTIDYGIDLGTTNSSIAVKSGVDAVVVKNNADRDTTPSAVWFDQRNRLWVGERARERSERDPDNTCVEFKLRMGTTGTPKVFKTSGRAMEPEELSAEVLKSLREDVRQRTGEDVRAAVITVPAAFEMPACDATRRAATAAGLAVAPLLQEPTAAALAYGFQTASDNVFWLAYDLGGGTFDAAIVHVRDGEFTVVEHRGDNFLGGKLIDWRIVEELLIPAVVDQHALPGLARGNQRWARAIAELKSAAENAKIRLSRTDEELINIELKDDQEHSFYFEHVLLRTDVERLAAPFLERSVNLCRTALSEARLTAADIEKVLLVGGPTLAPYVRDWLASSQTGLGIPLDHSQDPLTVVARGAAIFAGTQRVKRPRAKLEPGDLAVDLEYRPVGPDPEFLVGGVVSGPQSLSLTGFTVEFAGEPASGPPDDGILSTWRSGRIGLAADGSFEATLLAESGRENVFAISVHDAAGTRRKVTPDRLSYTIGVTDTQPPLTHNVGVGLHNNEVIWLVERGTPLPARRQKKLRTMVDARKGEGLIRIPVVEGEHARADRNHRIGRLEIAGDQITRSVPEGSEVQLTIEIDESRLVTATAYVPLLDAVFKDVVNLRTETVPRHDDLDRDTRAELERLEQARAKAAAHADKAAIDVLDRLDAENTVQDITTLVDAARVDPDAATTAGSRLLDLRAAIDQAEDALEWPSLVEDAEGLRTAVRELVQAKGDRGDLDALHDHESALSTAIQSHDTELLRQRVSELRPFAIAILDRTGELAKLVFLDLLPRMADMSDPARAMSLISQGQAAARDGDINALRNINRQLIGLLPSPPPPPDPFSTVGRG